MVVQRHQGPDDVGPSQLRAARASLNLSLTDVGRLACLSIASILALEGRSTRSSPQARASLEKLIDAYAEAGVSFFDNGPEDYGIRIV